MGIGSGIFLLAAGAILAFAVHATVAGINIQIVGWVLMATGVLSLTLTMLVFSPRRRQTLTRTRGATPGAAPQGPADPTRQDDIDQEVREDRF
jgi:hypothetical protein